MSDWNVKVIEEFRANEGRVGGRFEGAPLLLLHHTGGKSGTAYVTPMMYLPKNDVLYVFASKAGAPDDPGWYRNLTARTPTSVEVGTDAFPVEVQEITRADRDAIYAEQAALYPGFAEYEHKTKGIRTIPVMALTRD